jgi:hypothetical protein
MPHCAAFLPSRYTVTMLRGSASSSPSYPARYPFQRFPNALKPIDPSMPERQLGIAGDVAQGAVPSGPVFRVRLPNMLERLFACSADELPVTDQFDDARHIIRALPRA